VPGVCGLAEVRSRGLTSTEAKMGNIIKYFIKNTKHNENNRKTSFFIVTPWTWDDKATVVPKLTSFRGGHIILTELVGNRLHFQEYRK